VVRKIWKSAGMNQSDSFSARPYFTRRDMLKTSLLAMGGLAFTGGTVSGTTARAAEAAGARPMLPLNRFPRMVQEYYVERLREFEAANHAKKAALKTRAAAKAYVQSVRAKILDCFGPFPEKTPLNPRITGVIDRDAYRLEKVLFESRPGLMVAGNLYLPKGHSMPLPGVIGTCGHSDSGKAMEAYQSFAQGLARLGYVVLIFDPLGQGERLQYPDAQLKSRIGVGVREHLYAGNQQFLVGEFFGAWRAWDGIRALDYLLTRPEVDPRHIGVTGCSGGGTMTTWLCGIESRLTMAAPSCFVTAFRRNLENELPADTEQCPPRALALGLDHEDFIAAIAPKPVILLAKERDFFDIRGTESAYGRLKQLYRLLGAEQNISMFVGPATHGYSRESREAMYRWFNRCTGISPAQTEPALVIEKEATLWCSPHGQVSEIGSRSVPMFTRERSQALAKQRPALDRASLLHAVSTALKLPARTGLPEYRILRVGSSRRYPLPQSTTYAVNTEPGMHAIVYRLGKEHHEARPPAGPPRALLYVAHHSSDAELRDEPALREWIKAEPESAYYTCDVRGIGESRPDTCGDNSFLAAYGCDFFYAIHSFMLDQPYVGRKTHDVLRVLDWLKSCRHSAVHLTASGWGTVPATFAALFSDLVVQVTLKGAPNSYAEIAESEKYDWPLSSFVPGVLRQFDLPDCYRALEGKKLRLADARGESRSVLDGGSPLPLSVKAMGSPLYI
jgi:dienelactone hydrolase